MCGNRGKLAIPVRHRGASPRALPEPQQGKEVWGGEEVSQHSESHLAPKTAATNSSHPARIPVYFRFFGGKRDSGRDAVDEMPHSCSGRRDGTRAPWVANGRPTADIICFSRAAIRTRTTPWRLSYFPAALERDNPERAPTRSSEIIQARFLDLLAHQYANQQRRRGE